MNAASVPMLTISSSVPIGVSEATSATALPMAMVIRSGVPVRGLTLAQDAGAAASHATSRTRTRVAPIISVITTVVSPATAPAEISVA